MSENNKCKKHGHHFGEICPRCLQDAAPDLLAACEAVIEEYDNAIGQIKQAIPTVRRAIDKARGK